MTSTTIKEKLLREKSVEEIAETIKNVARNITQSSIRMRETVKTLRESGAIEELAEAVRVAAVASRDTAMEINETARQLNERGIIEEPYNAIQDTAASARDTAQVIRESVSKTEKDRSRAMVVESGSREAVLSATAS